MDEKGCSRGTSATTYFAHSLPGEDERFWQPLPAHLLNVGAAAGAFASVFDAQMLATVQGWLHDLGKYTLPFQERLRGSPLRVDHSTHGARIIAQQRFGLAGQLLAYGIAGHHAGLANGQGEGERTALADRLRSADLPVLDPVWERDIALPDKLGLPSGFKFYGETRQQAKDRHRIHHRGSLRMTAIAHRYEFVYLFDITNGNPNGDPDAGNLPRLDPETNRGLVTDVCLKRKVRNFVSLDKEDAAGYAIYMQEKAILNNQHRKAYDAIDVKPEDKKLPKDEAKAREITAWMCANFFDIRSFGAVMTTGVNAGQVRGPIQMAFATSIDPVVPLEISITRMAVTTEKEAEAQSGDNRTMGRKHIIPYGLYRAHGFISAKLAERTGFSNEDLDLFWRALINMFEHDRSAARGEMAARKLIVFEHESAMGNAPAHVLFDAVKVQPARGDEAAAPRAYADYEVSIDRAAIPAGVTVRELI